MLCNYIFNEYLKLLYGGNKGFVKIMCGKKGEYRFEKASDLCDPDKAATIFSGLPEGDLYMSLGTYINRSSARKTNLMSICAIAVDCDFRRIPGQEHISMEQVREQLDPLFGTYMPVPTYIEYSRNFRLVYVLSPFYGIPRDNRRNNTIKFLERISVILCERMNTVSEDAFYSTVDINFNAEPQLITSFVRVPESMNIRWDEYIGKKGVEKPRMSLYKVNLAKVGEPLSIDDITEKILPDKPEWYDGWAAKGKNKKKKKKEISSIETLCGNRLEGLKFLQEHGYDIGYRETMCYLYRLFCIQSGMTDKEAEEAMLRFNDGFKNPLPEKRAIVLTKPSNPAIKYRDKTLREMLDCEDYPVFKGTGRADEEKRASAKKYYRSRNPVPKKEKIKKASKKAKKLKDNGDTYDEIALKLHISRSTAINYVKKAA